MTKRTNLTIGLVVAFICAAAAFFAWQDASFAQPGGGVKLTGPAKETKGGFEGLLGKHGSPNMLLAVEVRVAGPNIDKVEHLGKLVQSTDSFLVIKLQNGQDLVFIPWEYVLWITARPSS